MVAKTRSTYRHSTYLTHKRREANNRPAFWLRFSATRNAARISQIELAMRWGISRPTIIAWEHSERIPSLWRGRRVLAYLRSLIPDDEHESLRQEIHDRFKANEPSVWQLKRAIGFAPQFDRTGSSIGANSSTTLVKPDRESWVEF